MSWFQVTVIGTTRALISKAMANHLILDSHEHNGRFDFYPSPVPVLRLRGALWDPVALDTWREALSGLVGVEVPHELMGLWLFASPERAILLGPAELAADDLEVPLPGPHVDPRDLWRLEERVRHAGYGSALAMGIPHGDRDVGLVLLASLEPDRYEDSAISFLRGVVAGLGPTMARVAQQWEHDPEAAGDGGEERQFRRREEPGRALHELRDLLAELAATVADSATPRELARGLTHAIGGVIPHDRLEIVVPRKPRNEFYRLGAHGDGALFSHGDLMVSGEDFDTAVLFDPDGTMVVEDADTDPRAPVWPLDPADAEAVKSVIGVRLGDAEDPIGYLMLGSLGPGLYRPDDLASLQRIGLLIAPKVEGFSLHGQLQTLRARLGVLRQVPAHLGRVAELLATTAHLGVATRMFAEEAAGVLPFERLEFALRSGGETEVIVVRPGESRSLRELSPVDVSGTELARVLKSEITHTLAASRQPGGRDDGGPSAAMVVPLRVAGRVTGTMTMVATGTASFGQADVILGQQLADVVAPHLELARRTALSGGNGSAPSWRPIQR